MRSKEGRVILNIGKEVERFSLDTINEDLLYEDICKYDDDYREVSFSDRFLQWMTVVAMK